jgi:VWFA-related protein
MRVAGMLLISGFYWAQSSGQAPAPEVSSKEAPITFTSKADLVLVPVVIRDKDGRAIGTLHEEDFQVFDKGKPQIITRFAIEKPATPPLPAAVGTAIDENGAAKDAGKPGGTLASTPLASQFVAYVFDDMHMKASDLLPAREAADRHLAGSFGAASRAAIYTTSGQVMLNFTDDRDLLHQTLMRVLPLNNLQDGAGCSDLTGYWADAIVNQNDAQALQAGVDEYLACSDSANNPAAAAVAAQIVRANAISQLSRDQETSRITLKLLQDVVRRIAATPGSRSLVLVSPGFFMTKDERPDETELINQAIRASVKLNTLDARGVYTVIPGGDASQAGRRSVTATNLAALMDINSKNRDADVMEELADATGARFFHNDNGFLQGFAQLTTEPEYVYVLGFSAQNLKLDGAYHALKVTLKNPKGLEMQARRGYYAPDRAVDPEEQAKQEIREAVFSQEELIDLPVDLSLQFLKSSDVSAKLNVLAKVDLTKLHFRKADDRNNNTLTVVSSVFDRNGNFVAAIKKVVDMRFKDETLVQLKSGVTVKTTLDVVPGSYMVRLVVRDSEDQIMAARSGVVEIR